MRFNVWYGGEQVSLGRVVEAIRAVHPDMNTFGTPLEPGDYEPRLMLDDSYTEVARPAPFQVVK